MPSDDCAEVLHKIEQVAARFQCSPRTIRNLIEAGELESVHLGRAVRITVASEDAYLERLQRHEAARRAVKAKEKFTAADGPRRPGAAKRERLSAT